MSDLNLKFVPGEDDSCLLDRLTLTCGAGLGAAFREYVRARSIAKQEARIEEQVAGELEDAKAAREAAGREVSRLVSLRDSLPKGGRRALEDATGKLQAVMCAKPAVYSTSNPKYALVTQPDVHPLVRIARNQNT